MESSRSYPLTGKVDVDEFFVGEQEEGKKGQGKEKKVGSFDNRKTRQKY